MEQLWFWLVSVMVALYVVLDGFDFGSGALHLFVAKSNEERRTVLGAIGPFWGGNEVWLIAAGGSLFLAFPKVLGAGFSGFYIAMFLVLWAIALRGLSVEFRSHLSTPMWRAFWDFMFAAASIAMPILLGTALGNVIRGVPLTKEGIFELDLFTTFLPTGAVGLLDLYTVGVGLFALLALTTHGSLFLAWRTNGGVHERSAALAPKLAIATGVAWPVITLATHVVNPRLIPELTARPLALLFTAITLLGVALVIQGLRTANHGMGFIGSGAFLLGALAATAALVWPVMLPSTLDPAWSLTALNSHSPESTLRTGLYWWFFGFPISLGYLTFLFRIHRGKHVLSAEGEGY